MLKKCNDDILKDVYKLAIGDDHGSRNNRLAECFKMNCSRSKHFDANGRRGLYKKPYYHEATKGLEKRKMISCEGQTIVCLPAMFGEIRKTSRRP